MKKSLFLFVLLTLVFSSCNKYTQSIASINRIEYNEEYIPKGEVEDIPICNGEFVYLDLIDSTYFLGDMLFSKEQVESLKYSETKAAFRTETSSRWSGIVRYYISSGFTTTAVNAIHSGISMLEDAVTSITFQESSSLLSSNGINFISTSGVNNSPVGKQSVNNINLQYNLNKGGVAAHEILHSLGYFHEQSRTDRDSYIIINRNNIKAGKEHNFQTFSQQGYSGKNFGPYDYQSIMHYDSYGFAEDESIPVITKLDGSCFNAQRTYLTNGDLAAIDRLYGPIPYVSSTIDHIEDYSQGDDIRQDIFYTNRIYFRDLSNNNVALEYDKSLKITLTTYHYEGTNSGNNSTSQNTFFVNIPAGSTFYDISGYSINHYHETCGISYLIHEENYSVEINP
ncbi:MAG: M12 family metallopeptidase [Candidatus Cryptobacteroides sp.]